jgi:hypothetical protein
MAIAVAAIAAIAVDWAEASTLVSTDLSLSFILSYPTFCNPQLYKDRRSQSIELKKSQGEPIIEQLDVFLITFCKKIHYMVLISIFLRSI